MSDSSKGLNSCKERGQQREGVCGALHRTACWGHSQGHGTKVFFLFQAQYVTPRRLGKTQECSSGVSLIFFQAPQERQEQHKTHPKAERPWGGRGNWQLMHWAALRKARQGFHKTGITCIPSLPTFRHKGCLGLCSSGLGCTNAIAPRVLLSPLAPSAVHVSLITE